MVGVVIVSLVLGPVALECLRTGDRTRGLMLAAAWAVYVSARDRKQHRLYSDQSNRVGWFKGSHDREVSARKRGA
jgi:hypothetical protein